MKPIQKAPSKVGDPAAAAAIPSPNARPMPSANAPAPAGAPLRPGAGAGTPGAKPRRPGKTPVNPKGKLIKTPKRKGIDIKDPVNIAIAAFAFVILMGVIWLAWPSSEPVVVQTEVENKPQVDEFPMDTAPTFPEGHYLNAVSPIDELARQVTEKALIDHQSYVAGQGLYFPDGSLIPEASSEFVLFKKGVIDDTQLSLSGMVQSQIDPTTGANIILVRDDTTGAMAPIVAPSQASSFENKAYRIASSAIDSRINQLQAVAPATVAEQPVATQVVVQQEPVIEKQVVVETVLDDTEKRKYIGLIETQERENRKLREKMSDLRDDLSTQHKQVVDVMQRIENSPSANDRLRATMIPESAGLKKQAIVGDRVWFEEKDGSLKTFRIGEVVDNTNLMISGTEEGSGIVLVTGN